MNKLATNILQFETDQKFNTQTHNRTFNSKLIAISLLPDRVFESRRDETKDYEISICCMHIAEVLQTWRLTTINRVFDLK